MEVTENQTTEVTQEIEPVQADPAVTTENDGADAAPEPEWKPNLKVKAYDKEYDIPASFHSFINKDNEKEVRDVFERAYALDVMKEKNQKIRAENEQFRTRLEKEYEPVVTNYRKLEKFLQNDDLDSFFANIPAIQEQKLQLWMLRRLKEKELPPEEQQVYNDARAARQRAYQLEEENNSYKQKFDSQTQEAEQAAINETLNMLDEAVAKPENSAAQQEFESRLGQDAGTTYKMEVLRYAGQLATKLKRDVSIEEAIASFNKFAGLKGEIANPAPAQANPAPQAQAQPKPTLPSLNGKATSPASQKIKSIDDLKKLRSQMIQAESRRSRE